MREEAEAIVKKLVGDAMEAIKTGLQNKQRLGFGRDDGEATGNVVYDPDVIPAGVRWRRVLFGEGDPGLAFAPSFRFVPQGPVVEAPIGGVIDLPGRTKLVRWATFLIASLSLQDWEDIFEDSGRSGVPEASAEQVGGALRTLTDAPRDEHDCERCVAKAQWKQEKAKRILLRDRTGVITSHSRAPTGMRREP